MQWKKTVTSTTTNKPNTTKPEEKPVPKSSKRWLFIVHGMYSICIWYLSKNALLLWMSVNVFLVVGIWKYYQCRKRCARTFFMVGNAESTRRSDCDFISFSLLLSLCMSLSHALSLSLSFSILCKTNLHIVQTHASILFSLFGRHCSGSLR